MPEQNIHVLKEKVSLEELCNEMAKLQKILRYLLAGNLDFENVRVKGLKAETVDVDELSAFTAHLGHVISGLIESVEIFGSYIATARGTFPRAEMSNTNNMFGAYGDANKYVKIESNLNNLGAPMTNYGFNGIETWLMQISSGFLIFGPNSNVSYTVNDLQLGGKVRVKGGAPQLGTINISPASDPDDAVIKVNEIIAVLRLMGILE